DALLLAQALNEMQVGFIVLHAVVALGVGLPELEAVGVGLYAMGFEHLDDDLRRAEVLENSLIAAVGQIGQLRAQAEGIAGQALAGLTLADAVDHAMRALAGWAVGEIRRAVEQRVEIQIRALADQLDFESVALV